MIAYVDENGMITSVPPELRQKEEINQEDILISTPKKEDVAPVILRGRVDYFNEAKGFGFIHNIVHVKEILFRPRQVTDKPEPFCLIKINNNTYLCGRNN